MGEFRKLPDAPTNADLADGVEQVHACLEEFKNTTAQAHTDIHTEIGEVKTEVGGVKDEIEHVAGQVLLLNKRLGIIDDGHAQLPKRKSSIALMTQGEAIWKGGLSITAMVFFWRLMNDLAPFLWRMVVEVNNFIIHYH